MITEELSLDLTEEEEAWWIFNESSANEEDLLNPSTTSPHPITPQTPQIPIIVPQEQKQSPTQLGDQASAPAPANPIIYNDENKGAKQKVLPRKKLRKPSSSESEVDEEKVKSRVAYRKEVEERRARAVTPQEQVAQTREQKPSNEIKKPLNLIKRPPRMPKFPKAENNDPTQKRIPPLMSLVIPVPEELRNQRLPEINQEQANIDPDDDREKDDEEIFIRNRPERGPYSFPFVRLPDTYMSTGVLFSGLDPVPYDRLVDAPYFSCFNCREEGHSRKSCPQDKNKVLCHNCGRWDVTVKTCPRCRKPSARLRYAQYREQMGEKAKPIWILYPHLFAAPPYGDSWQDDPQAEVTPPRENDDNDDKEAEPAISNSPQNPTEVEYHRRRFLLLRLFDLDLGDVPIMLRIYAVYMSLPDVIKLARKYKK